MSYLERILQRLYVKLINYYPCSAYPVPKPASPACASPVSLVSPDQVPVARSFSKAAVGPRLDANQEPRFLEQVKMYYESASAKTGIDPQYLKMIGACNTVIRFNIPLRRDNGDLETVTCYR